MRWIIIISFVNYSCVTMCLTIKKFCTKQAYSVYYIQTKIITKYDLQTHFIAQKAISYAQPWFRS